ncbi:MAG: XRE family transcriptional regulator [Candidatus Competibacteraceae bacterium]|nr:XRE family transcriptional regulator [Candidatus Competibacteraceae bacterium]
MSEYEQGSTNVYADLEFPAADEMLRKAQLTTEIRAIIKDRGWTQQHAAEVIGLPQPKLSEMLRGHFRGISKAKLLDCLTRLGCDVEIVAAAPHHDATVGRIVVSLPDT